MRKVSMFGSDEHGLTLIGDVISIHDGRRRLTYTLRNDEIEDLVVELLIELREKIRAEIRAISNRIALAHKKIAEYEELAKVKEAEGHKHWANEFRERAENLSRELQRLEEGKSALQDKLRLIEEFIARFRA